MPLNPKHEIYIVGVNVDRYVVYRGSKSKDVNSEPAVVKICQGVYMQNGLDAESVFNRYGLRIAHYLTPSATISFSTAWHKAPKMGRVFVTGQYQYVRPLFGASDRYNIVQSVGKVEPDNPKLHTMETFRDPLGEFTMLCDTPELTLLNMMTATKRHSEKHLNSEEMDELLGHLMKEHGGKAGVASALEEVAVMAERTNELRRLIGLLYSPGKSFVSS
ncbi:hypothetical protein [Xanthomonas campestris]|uniref:hypothetical protein n=1 Tax=Xanthomonas campestris TaxID=339 RepID=UPI000C288127|nr:hypothetical protein [Xanthomonas campestris]MCD0261687.1 hypothetical protein [Xanthomonas campestris pv. campestris]MCD0269938.1 hypothetical protein [Xanthomonas campestris pv. campestris]PJR22788.1 hypothetical protein ASJ34_18205 [Xanthomonas campestris pv. campestris]